MHDQQRTPTAGETSRHERSLTMSHSNTIGVQSAGASDHVQPSAGERLTSRLSKETLVERFLVAVTIGLLSVLAYSFSHALQNYRVF